MRYTWWVTRPKRDLVSVPICLKVVADVAQGRTWASANKQTELAIEQGLEDAGLKRPGRRRDQGGGGARTYRAWMKSLGLVFMDDQDRLQLTSAGQALLEGEAPLPILREQVLKYQFPSAYTYRGSAAVDSSFKVRPFIFLLQLLTDPRLEGWLDEKTDIALIAVCYGTSNSAATVEDVVNRILALRRDGLAAIEPDYVEKFASSRSKEPSFDRLVTNLRDIANTMRNWLGYSQLIDVEDGVWRIAAGSEETVEELIAEYARKPLIKDWDHEEKFQRRYGLKPGQRKDTRDLDAGVGSVSSGMIEEMRIDHAYLGYASTKMVARITPEVIKAVSTKTGITTARVESVLSSKYSGGSANWFMSQYVQLAFQSREKATEFERSTTSIFKDVFGFEAQHIGALPRRPDIVIASRSQLFGGIVDAKAYKDGYSATVGQRNRMRDYIEDFPTYAIDTSPLAFFTYVVSGTKPTIGEQIRSIADENGVPGSAISAAQIAAMVERHSRDPYSHEEIRDILSINREVRIDDLALAG